MCTINTIYRKIIFPRCIIIILCAIIAIMGIPVFLHIEPYINFMREYNNSFIETKCSLPYGGVAEYENINWGYVPYPQIKKTSQPELYNNTDMEINDIVKQCITCKAYANAEFGIIEITISYSGGRPSSDHCYVAILNLTSGYANDTEYTQTCLVAELTNGTVGQYANFKLTITSPLNEGTLYCIWYYVSIGLIFAITLMFFLLTYISIRKKITSHNLSCNNYDIFYAVFFNKPLPFEIHEIDIIQNSIEELHQVSNEEIQQVSNEQIQQVSNEQIQHEDFVRQEEERQRQHEEILRRCREEEEERQRQRQIKHLPPYIQHITLSELMRYRETLNQLLPPHYETIHNEYIIQPPEYETLQNQVYIITEITEDISNRSHNEHPLRYIESSMC